MDRPLLGRGDGLRDVRRAGALPRHRGADGGADAPDQRPDPAGTLAQPRASIQAISDWIERLLVKDPEERTRSAHDAWDELEEIVIALVGPRWRRAARLLAPSRRPADAPAGPATPPPDRRGPAAADAHARRPRLGPDRAVRRPPTRRLREDPAHGRNGHAGGADAQARATTANRATSGRGTAPGTGARRSRRSRCSRCSSRSPRSSGAVARQPRPRRATRRSPPRRVRRHGPRAGAQGAARAGRGCAAARRTSACRSRGAVAVAPRGRAAGPVVEFGMVTGDAAANSALLPAAFLDSIGHRPAGPGPHRGAAARAAPPGLALPRPAARSGTAGADRLRRADLRRGGHGGLRGTAGPGRCVRGPMRGDRRDASAPARDRLSGRPERRLRERPERGDRRPPAGHPARVSESRRAARPSPARPRPRGRSPAPTTSAAAQLAALELSPADRRRERRSSSRRCGAPRAPTGGRRARPPRATPTRTEPPAPRSPPRRPRSTPRWPASRRRLRARRQPRTGSRRPPPASHADSPSADRPARPRATSATRSRTTRATTEDTGRQPAGREPASPCLRAPAP